MSVPNYTDAMTTGTETTRLVGPRMRVVMMGLSIAAGLAWSHFGAPLWLGLILILVFVWCSLVMPFRRFLRQQRCRETRIEAAS